MKTFYAWRRTVPVGEPQWVPLAGRRVKHTFAKLWVHREGDRWEVIEERSGRCVQWGFSLREAKEEANKVLAGMSREDFEREVAAKVASQPPKPAAESLAHANENQSHKEQGRP